MDNVLSELISGGLAGNIARWIFAFAVLFFVIISVVLLYHWKKYEPFNFRMPFFALIYFGGALFFLAGSAYFLNLFIK